MRFRRLLAISGCTLALAACDEKDDDSASEEGGANVCDAGVTYENSAKAIVAKYCLGCHSSEVSGDARQKAPDDANFDTEAELYDHGGHVFEKIVANSMPPDNASVGKLTAAERQSFLVWLECSGAAAQHQHDDD